MCFGVFILVVIVMCSALYNCTIMYVIQCITNDNDIAFLEFYNNDDVKQHTFMLYVIRLLTNCCIIKSIQTISVNHLLPFKIWNL